MLSSKEHAQSVVNTVIKGQNVQGVMELSAGIVVNRVILETIVNCGRKSGKIDNSRASETKWLICSH